MELQEDNQPSLEAIVNDLKSHPEVTQVDLLAGKFDVLVTLDCADMESFSELAMASINKKK